MSKHKVNPATNATLIQAAYAETLGREADAGGFSAYMQGMSHGLSRDAMRAAIAHSDEAAGKVNQLYHEVLGRDADPGSLRSSEDALARGMTLDRLRAALAGNQEGTDRMLDGLLAAAQAGAASDPGRVGLIRDARSAADQAFAARAGGNQLLAALFDVQARVALSYAARPADKRGDKMLDVARRFVDAAHDAVARNDWNRVQTLETAADVSLEEAAQPEGQRHKVTKRFMHKKDKHDITVDPNAADPFASLRDHKKGSSDIGAIIQQVVGVVADVLSFTPLAPVAAPVAVAMAAAQAGQAFARGDALGGMLSLAGAAAGGLGATAGAGLVGAEIGDAAKAATRVVGAAQGLRGVVEGAEAGNPLATLAAAAGGAGAALGGNTELGRDLLAGSALAGAGVAAAGGDWLHAIAATTTAAAGMWGGGHGQDQPTPNRPPDQTASAATQRPEPAAPDETPRPGGNAGQGGSGAGRGAGIGGSTTGTGATAPPPAPLLPPLPVLNTASPDAPVGTGGLTSDAGGTTVRLPPVALDGAGASGADPGALPRIIPDTPPAADPPVPRASPIAGSGTSPPRSWPARPARWPWEAQLYPTRPVVFWLGRGEWLGRDESSFRWRGPPCRG